MTKFKEWSIESNVDLLVGGTPCQSFSVAGLRKGLDDPRGNLMLTYLAIADKYRPRWLVWENVPGVLSSNAGQDFGTFLGGLGELGYGFAYRVLDAQYFGVAQRRRRVFVVGYLGDWRAAAAVLFERHSLSGHPAPSREKRQVAPTLTKAGTRVSRTGHNEDGWYVETPIIAGSLDTECGGGKLSHQTVANGHLVQTTAFYETSLAQYKEADLAGTAKASGGVAGGGSETFIAQPIAFSRNDDGGDATHDLSPTMRVAGNAGGMLAAAVGTDLYNGNITGDVAACMSTEGSTSTGTGPTVMQSMAVRRLTPKECERLQGFPDNYTDIKSKGKPTPDGPRYKALGNSMAVPVMAWIGQRIQEVEAICKQNK
jgi:DNA (cytosine-5)-methyltransferase 1